MSSKLKKGDEVVVIAGDHKGSKGKILEVEREKNRILVEGINMSKKHERKTQDNPTRFYRGARSFHSLFQC